MRHLKATVVEVKANTVLIEKYLRRYPHVEFGDKVKIFDKEKGSYTSRRETRHQWFDKKHEVERIKGYPRLSMFYFRW